MVRWKLIAIAASGVALLSAALGIRARAERPDTRIIPANVPLELAPAIVIAKRPSLSEILDLVLHERPSASELAYAGSGDFPKGSDEAYVAEILGKRSSDKPLIHRIAAALVREGKRRNIGSQLLVGVLLTENPWLDPTARSSVGARGLMQVMPFHAGKWGCGSVDLFDIDSNICHGVAVLSDNLGRSRTLRQALRGYNGCVRGTNTPDCWKYPAAVYRRGSLGK
jgi:hypothetical protein